MPHSGNHEKTLADGSLLQKYKQAAVPALIGLFLVTVTVFYLVVGGEARFEVHDALDLFTPQYMVLKQTGTFFSGGVNVPFLGGIDRDYLPSELSIVSLCYMLLPGLAAHVALYLCKVVIAVSGAYLFAKELLLNDTWLRVRDRVLLCAFAYGILNLYPHHGIAFASLPLLLFLLLKIYRAESVKDAGWWYVPLFLYPFLSYFSFFGFFILLYLALFTGYRALRRAGGAHTLAVALPVLCAGFVVFEYRLFRVMLFSGVPTIRDAMGQTEISFTEALSEAGRLFLNGQMHTTSVHKYFVLPVCIIYILKIFIRNTANRKRAASAEPLIRRPEKWFLFCLLLVVLQSLVGGLAMFSPLRHAVETVFPFLKGFQFNRVYFFNPLLWYLMLCVALCDIEKRTGTVLAVIACAVALAVPVPYNSLFHSAYEQYYRAHHDGAPTTNLTYGDFFATPLFEKAKEDIGYDPSEYAVAYGFYPAVLQYNGISTLDGYHGYYPLAYKELFRRVIAPELATDEAARDYFERFGARCYLQPGAGHAGNMQFRTPDLAPNLLIDAEALRRDLGCRYVFSRIACENAGECGMRLLRAYEGEEYPYHLYVYVIE